MVKGPKNSSLYQKIVKPRVRETERIYKKIVRQNSRDQTFGSLYREVRYIRGSLYRDSAVLRFSLLPWKQCLPIARSK